jgi:pyruvate formate lyase activating enzyme
MEDNPPIKGFIETSFIDWKGQLASVVFTGGCNFRCPYCHNSGLVVNHGGLEDIPLDYIFLTLMKYKKWVSNIVVTGGEPTIHKGLFRLLGELKSMGMQIKLDTNGSSPSTLKGLVNDGLVDYIAMDLKGPVPRYKRWVGVDVDIARIEESLDFILEGNVDYEFRMTVVPFLHREEDVYEAAERIKYSKHFSVQEFRPRNTLNSSYCDIRPFPSSKIARIRKNVAHILTTADKESRAGDLEG